MKITISGKALAISAAVMLAIAAIGYVKTSPTCPDSTNITVLNTCNSGQQNWLSWIKGDSRSTQFHFVDFLELLNRLTPSSTKSN